VDVLALFAQILRNALNKSHYIVLGGLFYLKYALNCKLCARLNLCRGVFWDIAVLCKAFCNGNLHIQPLLEPVMLLPYSLHLGERVSWYHYFSLDLASIAFARLSL
jgi:hypothetical protein